MKQRRTSLPCGFQEDALIAAALDEADTTLQQAVHRHIRTCQECSDLLARYRSLQQVFTTLQDTRSLEEPLHRAQERLTQLLVRRWCISPITGSLQRSGRYALPIGARGVTAHLGGTGEAVALHPWEAGGCGGA